MELTGKRILIIVENLPVPFDRRVWQEANTLKNNGADIFIISPKAHAKDRFREEINGIKIFRHPLLVEGNGAISYGIEYGLNLLWEIYLAVRIYIKHGFDVIHACNPPDLIFMVALPFKLLGVKFLFDHHDINPELYLAKFGKKNLFYKMMILMERLTYLTANRSIATNESYKEIAIRRGRMDPEHVTIVRSGPKVDRLKKCAPNPTLKYGKSILIGYVGVIGQQEGIDHLLEVISILIKQFNYTDFHCTICGSGPNFEQMKILCKNQNLEDYVNFTGRIPDEQLLPILNTADICVNPDVWNDMNDKSTMNKVMEYMALGKPLVQYDLKEGKFSAQRASLYAEPNNREDFAKKILELVNNPKQRKEMGEFGENRIFSDLQWIYEEPKLLRAYSDLLTDATP